MLSAHEFATLMLVKSAPEQIDMNRSELNALLERQLIMLEHAGEGFRRATLTPRGKLFLESFDRSRAQARIKSPNYSEPDL
jgi:molybdenum-dependent DNA-binding transcriptional regulator ModE